MPNLYSAVFSKLFVNVNKDAGDDERLNYTDHDNPEILEISHLYIFLLLPQAKS